jgi:hypothetical protein
VLLAGCVRGGASGTRQPDLQAAAALVAASFGDHMPLAPAWCETCGCTLRLVVATFWQEDSRVRLTVPHRHAALCLQQCGANCVLLRCYVCGPAAELGTTLPVPGAWPASASDSAAAAARSRHSPHSRLAPAAAGLGLKKGRMARR